MEGDAFEVRGSQRDRQDDVEKSEAGLCLDFGVSPTPRQLTFTSLILNSSPGEGAIDWLWIIEQNRVTFNGLFSPKIYLKGDKRSNQIKVMQCKQTGFTFQDWNIWIRCNLSQIYELSSIRHSRILNCKRESLCCHPEKKTSKLYATWSYPVYFAA